MLSQLTKTIKKALKSTEEERAILRARSAVQRFPVIEWRQRMEDFHRRSIKTSRRIAGSNAWRESDCNAGIVTPIGESEDWNPVHQAYPVQPDWDAASIGEQSIHTHGSPAAWSQETLSPSGTLNGGGRTHDDSRATSMDGDADYFTHSRGGSAVAANTPEAYNDFIERANRTIARDHRNAPDPFLEAGLEAPSRPFGTHARVSSVDSISSIVEEKSNSPLNKAIASVGHFLHPHNPKSDRQQFTDADGGVASDFVQRLQMLTAKNSEHELSIEKYLVKSEEAFFGKVRKERLSSAASLHSSHRDSVWGTPASSLYSRPDCESWITIIGNQTESDYFCSTQQHPR